MTAQSADSVQLTIAIFYHHEQEEIEMTLRSLQGVADQVIATDFGLPATVRDRLADHSIQWVQSPWQEDISSAKNLCAASAAGQWILWLEAGETLDREEIAKLQTSIQELDRSRAYFLLIRCRQHGASNSSKQMAQIRLVPNEPTIKFQGRVSQQILPALDSGGFELDSLPIVISQMGGKQAIANRIRRAKRDIQLADIEIKETGPNSMLLNLLGQAFHDLENHQHAMEFFRQSLLLAERGSAEMLHAYCGLLSAMDVLQRSWEDRIAICWQALDLYPLDKQLLCLIGGYLHEAGHDEIATRCFETAVNHGSVHPLAWHAEEIDDVAVICLSRALAKSNQNQQALEVVRQHLENREGSPRTQRHLIQLLINLGEHEQACQQAIDLVGDHYSSEVIADVVQGAGLATDGQWTTAIEKLENAYQNGCHDPLCLGWLVTAHLSIGQQAAASEIVERWLAQDATDLEAHHFAQQIRSLHGASARGEESVRIDSANATPISQNPPNGSTLQIKPLVIEDSDL